MLDRGKDRVPEDLKELGVFTVDVFLSLLLDIFKLYSHQTLGSTQSRLETWC